MPKYQFALDKTNGKIDFIEVRNIEKDFSVSRNLFHGKGKDSEYYQVGAFASVHGFETDPKGIITKNIRPEWWPERFNDKDIHEAVLFLQTKYKKLNSPEYKFAYDELRAITYAIAMDSIENSPIEKFKDMGFTVGLQCYDDAVNIVKEALKKGIIKPQTDVTTFTFMDKSIDNALTYKIMNENEKKIVLFKIGSQYRLSVRENGKEIDGMPINIHDESEARKKLEEKHFLSKESDMSLNYERDYDKMKSIVHYMAQYGIENASVELLKSKGFNYADKYHKASERLVQEAIDSGIKPRSYVLCQEINKYIDRLFKCNEFAEVFNSNKPSMAVNLHLKMADKEINFCGATGKGNSHYPISMTAVVHGDKMWDQLEESIKAHLDKNGFDTSKFQLRTGIMSGVDGKSWTADIKITFSKYPVINHPIFDKEQADEWEKIYKQQDNSTNKEATMSIKEERFSTTEECSSRQLTDKEKASAATMQHHPGAEIPIPKPKSYLSKPEGLPDFPKLNKADREELHIFANKFTDSFPAADLTEIIKLCPIAKQMTAYGVQRCNEPSMTEERFNKLTDKQEVEINKILSHFSGIKPAFDYEPRGASIKLEMPNGNTLMVPELSSRKLTIEKQLEH